jgi:hypothetical protein
LLARGIQVEGTLEGLRAGEDRGVQVGQESP